jgi:hypothetical protein
MDAATLPRQALTATAAQPARRVHALLVRGRVRAGHGGGAAICVPGRGPAGRGAGERGLWSGSGGAGAEGVPAVGVREEVVRLVLQEQLLRIPEGEFRITKSVFSLR